MCLSFCQGQGGLLMQSVERMMSGFIFILRKTSDVLWAFAEALCAVLTTKNSCLVCKRMVYGVEEVAFC